jgi:predicted RNA binding protein YcfA (HicA-like mRNA interferase family)
MARRFSSDAFLRILTHHGFQLVSQKGSHAKYRDSLGHTVIVPHPRKDIPVGTVRSMIRQSGLPPELFD